MDTDLQPTRSSPKAKWIIIIVSIFVAVAVIGGALLLTNKKGGLKQAALRPVSQEELKSSDGKNGHTCLVAVDGIVYKIEGFALWHDGQHETSNGLAYCGADLSKVIDQAPHGRTKLDQLEKVGPLTN